MHKTALICGSRDWTDRDLIYRVVDRLSDAGASTIIHGDCRGADIRAGNVGKELGLEVRAFPANWDQLGRAAGHIRNQQMLNEGQPDVVVAFHDRLIESKGTLDMVQKAKDADVITWIVTHESRLPRWVVEDHICPFCGLPSMVHNDDGSCIRD